MWPGASVGSFLFSSLITLGFSLLLSACYEPTEGCLDVNAVNFGLDTDRECADCCTYPVLSIQFSHVWEDADTNLTFNYGSEAFQDAVGQIFAIDRITFYVHDFALLTEAGVLQYTTDSVEVLKLAASGLYEETFIRDDYLLLNPALRSALEVGTLLQNGTFTQLRFQVGLDAETDDILPGSLPTNHALSLLDTTMYDLDQERYWSNRLALQRDTAGTTPSLLLTYGTERLPLEVALDIPGNFALPPGLDLDIVLKINYAQWFAQVENIREEGEEELLNKIVAELPNSISFVEISANER